MPSSQFETAAQAAHVAAHVAVSVRKDLASKNAGVHYGGMRADKDGAKNLKTALAVQRLAMK